MLVFELAHESLHPTAIGRKGLIPQLGFNILFHM